MQVRVPASATMSSPSPEEGSFSEAPTWALCTTRTVSRKSTGNGSNFCSFPENSSAVWELRLKSTVDLHCVPMELVAMPVCVLWLRSNSRVEAASVDVVMVQLFDADAVECGRETLRIVF